MEKGINQNYLEPVKKGINLEYLQPDTMTEQGTCLVTGTVHTATDTITSKEAADILLNRDEYLDYIRIRTDALGKEYSKLKRNPVDELAGMGKPEDDVSAELQKIYDTQKSMLKELRTEFSYLRVLSERIRRLTICLKTLPPREYIIIYELYVEHQKWEHVSAVRGMSKCTISNIRESGLNQIVSLYNSYKSTEQLEKESWLIGAQNVKLQQATKKKAKKSRADTGEAGHQMSISELLMKEG